MWRVGVGGPCAPHIILGGFVLNTNILSLKNVFMGVDRTSRLLRSSLCLLLILVLLFSLVTRSFAVVAVSSVVISTVLAAMGAFGLGTLVDRLSQADVSDWLSGELNSWASSLNDTVSNLLPVASIAVNPLGALTLMPSSVLKVVNFCRWLTTKYNVSAGGSSVNVVSVSFASNQPFRNASPSTSSLKFNLVTFNSNKTFQLFPDKDWNYYCFVSGFSEGQLSVTAVTPGDHHSAITRFYRTDWGGSGGFGNGAYSSSYGLTYWTYSFAVSSYTSLIPVYSSVSAGLAALSGFLGNGPSTIALVPDGAIDYPDYVGDDEEEMPYAVDWGGLPGVTVEEAADAIMDKVVANELVSSGSVERDPADTTWPDIMTPPLVHGLDTVFPFCIPFDIYHFFQALSATPVAPRFEIPFYIPNLINYTMVIDLSGFNSVAQIFRTMELLAFCIGLAFVTRKLIRG